MPSVRASERACAPPAQASTRRPALLEPCGSPTRATMDSVRDTDGAQAALTQPNPENKLFVGGAPPGTDEDTLKKIFAEHGEVEEVFVMRGGSRSGQ